MFTQILSNITFFATSKLAVCQIAAAIDTTYHIYTHVVGACHGCCLCLLLSATSISVV